MIVQWATGPKIPNSTYTTISYGFTSPYLGATVVVTPPETNQLGTYLITDGMGGGIDESGLILDGFLGGIPANVGVSDEENKILAKKYFHNNTLRGIGYFDFAIDFSLSGLGTSTTELRGGGNFGVFTKMSSNKSQIKVEIFNDNDLSTPIATFEV